MSSPDHVLQNISSRQSPARRKALHLGLINRSLPYPQVNPSSSHQIAMLTPAAEPFPTNDPLFNVSFDPNFAFGSEAANLEYSILSAILGNPSPPDSASATAPSPSQPHLQPAVPNSAWSPEPLHTQPHYQPAPQQTYPFADSARLSMSEPTLAATAQPSPTTAFITYSPTQFSRPSQDATADLSYPTSYPQSLPPRYSRDPITTASMGTVRLSSKEAGPHSLEPSAHPSPSSTSSTRQSSLERVSVCRPFVFLSVCAKRDDSRSMSQPPTTIPRVTISS